MLKIDRRKLDLILAEQCLNLLDLSKISGVSYPLITKVASGKCEVTTRTLRKIARALYVKPEELIQD